MGLIEARAALKPAYVVVRLAGIVRRNLPTDGTRALQKPPFLRG